MALVWVDGFDTHGVDEGDVVAPSGILGRKYPSASGTWRVMSPRIIGNGHSIQRESGYINTPVLTTDSKLIVGFAFHIRHWALGIESGTVFEWYHGSTRRVYAYWHARPGTLSIRLDKAVDETIDEIVAKWYLWQYVEIALDTSAGTYEARLNGEVIGLVSGLSFDSINDSLRLGNGTHQLYDDFYVCDGTGSKNNDFLGPRKVVTIRPTADVVGYQDWTPSTGVDHYAVVDEEESNDDTDYISEIDTDETDLFEMGDVSSVMSEVDGMMICADARKENGDDDFNLRLPVRLSAVVDEGSSIVVSETDYAGKYRISEDKPGTGDWMPSDVDSVQIGARVPS